MGKNLAKKTGMVCSGVLLLATAALSGCAESTPPPSVVYHTYGPYIAYSQPSSKMKPQKPLHCIRWKEVRHIHRTVRQILHHNADSASMCSTLKTLPGCWASLGHKIAVQQHHISTMSAHAYYCQLGHFNRELLSRTFFYLIATHHVATDCQKIGVPGCLHGYWPSVAKQERQQIQQLQRQS